MADFEVKIATDAREIEQAQRLRFNVFNLELHKGLASSYEHGLDIGGSKNWPRIATIASSAESEEKIYFLRMAAVTRTSRRRHFPVNCFLMFSTNSFNMASAFLRMIGWPNSPILPKIFTSVSTTNAV